VAGLWAVESTRGAVVLTITPFAKLPARARRDLEGKGDRLVRFVEPDANGHAVVVATPA